MICYLSRLHLQHLLSVKSWHLSPLGMDYSQATLTKLEHDIQDKLLIINVNSHP